MINLIVAYAKNRVIGANGKIPWFIKEELVHFKEVTMGSTLIMGRRTFEEIGRPLPGREIIVLSNSKEFVDTDVLTARSLEEALQIAKYENVFIAGGASLYAKALPIVQKMYITEIDLEVAGDCFFPEFDETEFIKVPIKKIEGPINYQYFEYIRKSAVAPQY